MLELGEFVRNPRENYDSNGGLTSLLELRIPEKESPLPFHVALSRLGIGKDNPRKRIGLRWLAVNFLGERGLEGTLRELRLMVKLVDQEGNKRLIISTEPWLDRNFALFGQGSGLTFVEDLSQIATGQPPFLARATLFAHRNLPTTRTNQGVLVVSAGLPTGVHPRTAMSIGFTRKTDSQ